MNLNFTHSRNPGDSDSHGQDESTSLLNRLLGDELAAASIYQLAVEKLVFCRGQMQANQGLLREIGDDHRLEADAVRARIHELGGVPAEGPVEEYEDGIAWAKFTIDSAGATGWASVLRSLREEENRQQNALQESLSKVDHSTADLMESRLIPAHARHITLLDQLIAGVERVQ